MTSAQVLEVLAKRHEMSGINSMPGRWVLAREVQAETGSYGGVQRFDAVAIGLVPSVDYARVVYEIKVSRGDWLRELQPLLVDPVTGFRYRRVRQADRESFLLEDNQRYVEQAKWAAALEVSTEFWIAAPPRCVQLSELPAEAGLVEVRPWGHGELRARVVRQAPIRETPTPGAPFWAAVLRRAAERVAT